jgi:hypothetical protein
MDDDVRKAAVGAIKEKAAALASERAEIRHEMAELDRRLRRNEVALLDCRSAARLFDTDIELPEELATARGVWVRRIMNDPGPTGPTGPSQQSSPDRMPLRRLDRPTPPTQFLHPPLVPPDDRFGSAQVRLGPGTIIGEQRSLLSDYAIGEPTVREIALEQLKRAGAAGTRAANIRQVVQNILKKTVHDKTVGMTLYRLSKEGKVRRDGQTWFIAQEAVNPGAPTPGSEDRNR